MSEHPPRIRVRAENGYLLIRDGVSLTFYMRHPHVRILPGVMRSLDAYVRAVGEDALGIYAGDDGYWQKLDDAGWAYIREKLLNERRTQAHLSDASVTEHRYRFDYYGDSLEPLPWDGDGSNLVSAVSFWLPTEYLEQHGPGRVRELALELAAPLPFCSGHAGLSFNCETDLLGVARKVQEYCFRYPGMDIPDPSLLASDIGTRVKGVHWLNFLGQPVLGELGGTAGLRARLHSPGTTVQELEGERVVVTLGPRPEAGDTEQGDVLPAYRELARVLEPWLYRTVSRFAHLDVPEHVHRWERRFLD
jgi:TseV toxin immunity protein TsiV